MIRWACLTAAAAAAAGIAAPVLAAAPNAAPDRCQWSDEGERRGSPFLVCQGSNGAWTRLTIPHEVTPTTVASAEAGDPAAMTDLGMFYIVAPAPIQNSGAGLAWLKKAAAKSYGPAMRNLGEIYHVGDGAALDLAESVRWNRAAAEAGEPQSMRYLGSAYMTGRGIARDYAEALRWYQSAADHGLPAGLTGVGLLYANGFGVQKNLATAASWFRRAADLGDVDAMRDLAYMASNGLGMAKDESEADKWRRAAAARIRWIRLPSDEDLQSSYPIDAAVHGITGRVDFWCRLGADRSPHDCLRKSEEPPNAGFTQAARTVIGRFQLAPGLSEGAEIGIPIQFKLDRGREPRARADDCAAYAIALSRLQALTGLPDWWARYWIALSRDYAVQAGEADSPDRLTAQVAEASDHLSRGKERGLFGKLSACSLR